MMKYVKSSGTFLALVSTLATAALADGPAPGNPILDPSAMDTTVNPCQDFYQYSCGSWLARTTLPSDQSDWARSFSVISEQNLTLLQTVLTNYSQGIMTPVTPYSAKLGDFFASCMDEAKVEQDTPGALAFQLDRINQLQDKKDLPALLAQLHLDGMGDLFGLTAAADLKDPTLEIAEIDQGGLGLPDSTYYTKTDADAVKLQKQYQDHIARMFQLAGQDAADASANAALAYGLELDLAKVSLPPEQLQDPTKLYHPTLLADLQTSTPSFNWTPYFAGLGIAAPGVLNAAEPAFLTALDAVIQASDLPRLKAYLSWQAIETVAPYLGQAVYAEYFAFEGTILNGRQTPAPRWKRCVRAVSGGMSEALGQAFVAQTFTPEAKARVIELIARLREAFHNDLSSLEWLDAPTRAAALAKLDLVTQKIGYPDTWRNYDGLAVTRGSYWRNARAAGNFENLRVLGKIGGKVDPSEWGMSPQTVNAYYDPSVNQINFPAGILQPPFFSNQANDASNFGAIGMVIGHEMTHGFDTSGSQFDGHGAELDWWTPAVKEQFTRKAECLENQYSQYTALPGLNVNGKLTITENIADQGGLKLAFAAYKLARAGLPAEAEVAGLSPEQQFFVSMAQLWCEKQTDEALGQQVSGDPHSPAKFRVIGTVVNSPDFQAAFGCQAGDPMAPAVRCDIW